MNFLKIFLLGLIISNFLSGAVSSKSIPFCLEKHNLESLHLNLNNSFSDKSCRSITQDKQIAKLCLECDCHSSQIQSVFYDDILKINYLKSNFDLLIVYFYSLANKSNHPPPKLLSFSI